MGLFQKLFGRIVEAKNNYHLVKSEHSRVMNIAIAYNQYGAYAVPISGQHRTLNQRMLKGEVFEPDTIRFVIDNCGDGDIVHAGTAFGDFLPAFSRAIRKDAKIWAFEPNPMNLRCAHMTMLLNDLSNIELFSCGLGEFTAELTLQLTDKKGRNLGGSSTIVKAVKQGVMSQEIKVRSVDEVIPEDRKISILQLDVEGHEEEALKGAINTIRRCRPILILENDHKVTDTEWFKENIMSLDYEIKGKLHYNALVMPR
jgi:FkbM family methyltransferase